MNRAEFMRQLEILLQNIPPTEREEALQYYNDYFNDAGVENEQAVIEALGTPARVAENIKRDLNGNGYGDSYADQDCGKVSPDAWMVRCQKDPSCTEPVKEGNDGKLSTGMIVLIVILCILASPLELGIGSAVLGVAVGLIAAWFSLIIGFGAVAIAMFATMLALLVAGFVSFIPSPWAGLMLLGGSILCGGIGLLFLLLTVAMAGMATPAICRGGVRLCRSLFGKMQLKG